MCPIVIKIIVTVPTVQNVSNTFTLLTMEVSVKNVFSAAKSVMGITVTNAPTLAVHVICVGFMVAAHLMVCARITDHAPPVLMVIIYN